jgi:hypothetical protein
MHMTTPFSTTEMQLLNTNKTVRNLHLREQSSSLNKP